jgi:hypothetical protein
MFALLVVGPKSIASFKSDGKYQSIKGGSLHLLFLKLLAHTP